MEFGLNFSLKPIRIVSSITCGRQKTIVECSVGAGTGHIFAHVSFPEQTICFVPVSVLGFILDFIFCVL